MGRKLTKKTNKRVIKKVARKTTKKAVKKTGGKKRIHLRVPAGSAVKVENGTVTVQVGPEKPRDTIVSFLLDESGSMGSCLQQTIGGFNEYINGLKKKAVGNTAMTLTKFEGNNVVVVHNVTPIGLISELNTYNYRPGGGTPLFDAIGRTIRALEATLAGRTDKPAVLFTIMTDGQENASREFNRESIRALIKQKEAEGWDFTYLGAHKDAYTASADLGFSLGNTVHYAAENTKDVFVTLCSAHTSYTDSMSKGLKVTRSALFSADDKARMESGTDTTQNVAGHNTAFDTGALLGKTPTGTPTK